MPGARKSRYGPPPGARSRTRAITPPNSTSQSTGCMARVASSPGSWRSLRASASATASTWVAQSARKCGSERLGMFACAKTGLSRVTIASTGLDGRAGQFLEHVIETRIRRHGCLELRRCADRLDPAGMHDGHAVTERLGLVHVMSRDQHRAVKLAPQVVHVLPHRPASARD